ncbi:MAG: hydrolase [Legionella sp.]|nr:hydrolase [Legionella sp.]
MLIEQKNACLVLIDVQEKLAMQVHSSHKMLERCEWLLTLASELNIPCILSEQYPQGLGKTVPALTTAAQPFACIDKVHFSCYRNASFKDSLHKTSKKQCVLIGIETHVCVLQTAIDLKQAGYDVFIVVDAVSSRHHEDHAYALKRMQQEGIFLVTSEMVFFEWVEKAGTPEFKAMSKKYLLPPKKT